MQQQPTVQGVLAPHVPAEIYRDGDRLVIVQALPTPRADWGGRFAALGFLLAAGVGTAGLVFVFLAALDAAAHVAAGVATPAGVTVTASIAGVRRGKS